MGSQTITASDGTVLDAGAVNLAKAIRARESKGNYNAVGDAGTSKGAYQWQPGNFESAAKQYGLDPNDFSPVNQDKVAYHQVKALKDKGYTPEQVAASWNAGEGSLKNDAWKGYVGDKVINGQNVHYDTPSYVDSVVQEFNKMKGQSSNVPTGTPITYAAETGGFPQAPTTPQPLLSAQEDLMASTPQTTPDNLGTDLSKRVQEGTQAATEGLSAATQGNIHGAASGLLQTVGAAAGAIGDTASRALELIPGVKQVENMLGQGVGALASTPTGQSVVKSIQDFSEKNPELAKDIGAGFNIVTAIPILRGLGIAGSIAKDAAAQALKKTAEKSFVSSLPDVIGSTKAGARFITNNPSVAQDMVDRRLVGNIEKGVYTTAEDQARSWHTITDLNKQVGQILDRPEYATVGQDGKSIAKQAIEGFTNRNGKIVEGIPQSGMTPEELIANAKKLDPNNSLLWDKFEAGQANLKEINQLRSSLDSKVKKVFIGPASIDSPEVAVSKENGALLSGAMRDSVQTAAPSTAVPFNEMAKQFDIQKALELLDGKKIKPGMLSVFTGHAAGIGTGGLIGGILGGGPTGALIGGMIGDRAAGTVAKKIAKQSLVQSVLDKTGVNATRTGLKKTLTGLGGLLGGVAAQKANSR